MAGWLWVGRVLGERLVVVVRRVLLEAGCPSLILSERGSRLMGC
jgi:hypothetical protein